MVDNYKELKRHVGHEMECVQYGNRTTGKMFQNVAIECLNCQEIMIDYDKPRTETKIQKQYDKLYKIEDQMVEMFLQDHDFVTYVFNKYFTPKERKEYNNLRKEMDLPLIKKQ